MLLFLDRTRRDDSWLEWKVAVFTVGAVLGLAGMALEIRWLVWAAIVILALGFLLRVLPDRGGEGEEGGG